MSWIARVRRLTRNFISHGFGGSGGAPPVPPTTKGCLDLTIAPTTAMLVSGAPTVALELSSAPAFTLDVHPFAAASLLVASAPTATLTLTFEAC